MMCFCAEYCIRKNGAAEFKRSRQLFRRFALYLDGIICYNLYCIYIHGVKVRDVLRMYSR